jgi:hypothetical protein
MPCPEHGSLLPHESKFLKDWSNLHPYIPLGGVFTPHKRADIVAMVQNIEQQGVGKAKAIGSDYSLSAAPDSDGAVIDTKALDRHLSQPFGPRAVDYVLNSSRFPEGRRPCEEIYVELGQLKTGKFKKFIPQAKAWIEVVATPKMIAAKQKELDECLKKAASEPLRFWQLVIDPASGTRAWITRRRRTTDTTEEGTDKKNDLFDCLCANNELAVGAAITAIDLLVKALLAMAEAIVRIWAPIPFVGPVIGTAHAAPYFELAGNLQVALLSFSSLGSFVPEVFDLLRKAKDSVGHGIINDTLKDIVGNVIAAQHDPPLRRGPSEKILDTHDYDMDGCESANSGEFFFDAASGSYIKFVDEVLQKAKDVGPIMGYVSLRFVRETMSKLGMQRFPLTVCIEVAIAHPGSVNDEYKKAAHALALKHGGIPHWGQEHSLNQAQVEQLYHDHLEPWRWAVAETELSIEGQVTFSSQFTRERGLEVDRPHENLNSHRARRYVAAIISGT